MLHASASRLCPSSPVWCVTFRLRWWQWDDYCSHPQQRHEHCGNGYADHGAERGCRSDCGPDRRRCERSGQQRRAMVSSCRCWNAGLDHRRDQYVHGTRCSSNGSSCNGVERSGPDENRISDSECICYTGVQHTFAAAGGVRQHRVQHDAGCGWRLRRKSCFCHVRNCASRPHALKQWCT